MSRLFPLILLFVASTAAAQPTVDAALEEAMAPAEEPVAAPEPPPCPDGTCVEKKDLELFLQLAKDHKCRSEQDPKIKSDSVTIIVDRKGRVFGSGTGPKPYKLHIEWCNYEIDAKSNIELQVAQREEPTWGFRLRFKATFGLLVADIITEDEFHHALDGGVLFEPFFVHWGNFNVYAGVKSFGAGLGFDLTQNFGLYGGYALTWASWRSNPFASFYFAF
jgi:hypothetical protein